MPQKMNGMPVNQAHMLAGIKMEPRVTLFQIPLLYDIGEIIHKVDGSGKISFRNCLSE